MKSKAEHRTKGASEAFKGLKKGSSWDLNGCRAGINKIIVQVSSGDDPTVKAKTVVGSPSINQHKTLAMTGHT